MFGCVMPVLLCRDKTDLIEIYNIVLKPFSPTEQQNIYNYFLTVLDDTRVFFSVSTHSMRPLLKGSVKGVFLP